MTQKMHQNRGGKRPGAGRPRGLGKFGEPTKPVRIPQSLLPAVHTFVRQKIGSSSALDAPSGAPLYACKVAAGFPSPADDFLEGHIDLNQHLIKHPAATFFVRVTGDSMINAGIHADDLLIVDRSQEPRPGRIVIAVLNGELTVKRYGRGPAGVLLLPENPAYTPISVGEDEDFHIWGVVTNVIHAL